MQNVRIQYNLTPAACLELAQAGHECHQMREVMTGWNEIGRELIRPEDVNFAGEANITIRLPDQNELLSRETAIAAARVFRAGEIAEAGNLLRVTLATPPDDQITSERGPRMVSFEGEDILPAVAKWPENVDAYFRKIGSAWSDNGHAAHLVRLLQPENLDKMRAYHAEVVALGKAFQKHLDETVNKLDAAEKRTARETKEADKAAFEAACGRWLASIDPVVGLAVVEGTISPAGIAARLRGKLTLAVQAGTPSVGEFMTEDPGDDSDKHALTNKWAPLAAEIVRDVRAFLEPTGELTGWSTLRWTEDGNVVAWTLELSTRLNVPGYTGERKFPLELRAGFAQ